MASNITPLTEGNIYEWICSTGYLVPTTEKELARFEKLHPTEGIIVNAEDIIEDLKIRLGSGIK